MQSFTFEMLESYRVDGGNGKNPVLTITHAGTKCGPPSFNRMDIARK